FGVASTLATLGRRWLARVAVEPVGHDVVIKLLRPKQAGVGLTHDAPLRCVEFRRAKRFKKLIRLAQALLEDPVEVRPQRVSGRDLLATEPQANETRLARRNAQHIMRGGLRADPLTC